MRPFPGNCAPDGLVNVHTLGISQFPADAARIDHDMLCGVDAPSQRFRQTPLWNAHDTALPPGSFSYFLDPCGHAIGEWLAHVVNAARGALISNSERNSIGNVLHIAMRPFPLGLNLVEQDGRAMVI